MPEDARPNERERVSPRQDENFPKSSRFEPLNHPAHSIAGTLRAFPLLPGGEGRDEGERHTIFEFMGRGNNA